MSDDEPIKAYLGNYDLASTDVLIPAEALRRASDAIEVERQRRRRVAEEAQAAAEAAALERANKRPWWRKLREMFWRG